ncbi:MAG: metallophosphoesterase [Brevinematales bacterium]|nr:metallophosphoesterase [Brevinematales bacterium]
MIKILVMSDSHGRKDLIHKLVEASNVDLIFHLGDFSQDVMDIVYEKNVYSVKGNMDPLWPKTSDYAKEEIVLEVESLKVWLLHGHRYEAHFSTDRMLAKAREKNYQLVCYGHTHKKEFDEREGIYFFNPGALKDGSYGFIKIDKGKIEAELRVI